MAGKIHADSSNEPEAPSRSELKRQSAALQKLGEELAALSPAVWKTFGLSPDLYAALTEQGRIKSHEGKRRQLQFIGRLMREENSEQIAADLERLKAGHNLHTAAFHQLEQLRDSILQNDHAAWSELEKRLAALAPSPDEIAAETGPEAGDAPGSATAAATSTTTNAQAVLGEIRKLARQAIQKQDKGSSRALFRALRAALRL